MEYLHVRTRERGIRKVAVQFLEGDILLCLCVEGKKPFSAQMKAVGGLPCLASSASWEEGMGLVSR